MFFLLLLPFVITIVETATFATQCFLPTYHRGISNSPPIAELWKVTPYDCLTYCIVNSAKMGNRCHSVVYHRHFSTCQLYSHDGTANASQIVYAAGHDYYNRTSFEELCQDRKAVPQHSERSLPKSGSNLRYAPPKYRYNNNRNPNLHTIVDPVDQLENSIDHDDVEPSTTTVVPSTTTYSNDQVEILEETEATTAQPEKTTPQPERTTPTPTAMFFNSNTDDVCSKTGAGYFLLPEFEVVTTETSKPIVGVDHEACLNYCSQNIDNTGDSHLCSSVNYDLQTEQCNLLTSASKSEDRLLPILTSPRVAVFDKFCLPSEALCQRDGVFKVHFFQQLTKKIIAHFDDMKSATECLAECIQTAKCQAVTYKSNLCILHAIGTGDLTDADLRTIVIENACAKTSTENEEAFWSEWSECKYRMRGQKVRVRTRQCNGSDDCQNFQSEAC
uniref:Apple domain-containing protein n=1 Tax=Steinernema glaseri TaxID=37863 RepID=A0A1I7ZVA4_9BILA